MPVLRIPVNLAWNGPGSPGVNVFHARVSDVTLLLDTTAYQAGQVLGELLTFYSGIASLFPTGWTATIGQDIVNVETQEYVAAGPAQTVSGSGGATNAPTPIALVCSWRTTLAARRGRGRTFFGPLAGGTQQADGTPDVTAVGLLQSKANALVTASDNVNGWALGVWGQQAEGVPGTNVLRDFTGASVKDKWAVLRSRRD